MDLYTCLTLGAQGNSTGHGMKHSDQIRSANRISRAREISWGKTRINKFEVKKMGSKCSLDGLLRYAGVETFETSREWKVGLNVVIVHSSTNIADR